MTGSLQLRRYLALRADGATMMTAAVQAGISIAEARLTDNAMARGELTAPEPTPATETIMPKSKEQESVEVQRPDFEKAVKIFRQDIKPALEGAGEQAQLASTAYKAIKKDCHVNTRAAKFIFKLAGESEEKRNDVLRSVRGLLEAMQIGITDDLVSDAEGEDTGAAVVPSVAGEKLELATLQ